MDERTELRLLDRLNRYLDSQGVPAKASEQFEVVLEALRTEPLRRPDLVREAIEDAIEREAESIRDHLQAQENLWKSETLEQLALDYRSTSEAHEQLASSTLVGRASEAAEDAREAFKSTVREESQRQKVHEAIRRLRILYRMRDSL